MKNRFGVKYIFLALLILSLIGNVVLLSNEGGPPEQQTEAKQPGIGGEYEEELLLLPLNGPLQLGESLSVFAIPISRRKEDDFAYTMSMMLPRQHCNMKLGPVSESLIYTYSTDSLKFADDSSGFYKSCIKASITDVNGEQKSLSKPFFFHLDGNEVSIAF